MKFDGNEIHVIPVPCVETVSPSGRPSCAKTGLLLLVEQIDVGDDVIWVRTGVSESLITIVVKQRYSDYGRKIDQKMVRW